MYICVCVCARLPPITHSQHTLQGRKLRTHEGIFNLSLSFISVSMETACSAAVKRFCRNAEKNPSVWKRQQKCSGRVHGPWRGGDGGEEARPRSKSDPPGFSGTSEAQTDPQRALRSLQPGEGEGEGPERQIPLLHYGINLLEKPQRMKMLKSSWLLSS